MISVVTLFGVMVCWVLGFRLFGLSDSCLLIGVDLLFDCMN